MTNEFTFQLTGAQRVMQRLREFPPKLQKKGIRRAARVSMKIVQDSARSAAKAFDDPETNVQIWRLIVIRDGKMREPGIRMRVGVAGGARSSRSKDPPWYWRLIELGTERMRARPFMRPALESNAEAVAERFERELNVELDILAATER